MKVREATKEMFYFFVKNDFDVLELQKFLLDYIKKGDLFNKSKTVTRIILNSFIRYKEFKMGDKNDYKI